MKDSRESGAKQSDIKLFTDKRPVDKQGNQLPMVVAKVAACVAHYRKWHRSLKTIFLCPAYYNQFDYWVRKKALEMESDAKTWNMLTFDGVEIHIMSEFHVVRSREGTDQLDWEFYERPKTIEA